jgi:hypothetical protein
MSACIAFSCRPGLRYSLLLAQQAQRMSGATCALLAPQALLVDVAPGFSLTSTCMLCITRCSSTPGHTCQTPLLCCTRQLSWRMRQQVLAALLLMGCCLGPAAQTTACHECDRPANESWFFWLHHFHRQPLVQCLLEPGWVREGRVVSRLDFLIGHSYTGQFRCRPRCWVSGKDLYKSQTCICLWSSASAAQSIVICSV